MEITFKESLRAVCHINLEEWNIKMGEYILDNGRMALNAGMEFFNTQMEIYTMVSGSMIDEKVMA